MYKKKGNYISFFISSNKILIFCTPVTHVRGHAKIGGFPSRASFEVLFAA